MRIGEKLEILRQEGKLTQARLTEIIGGDQSTISKILAGKPGRNLNLDQILRIARQFHVTVESLLDDEMELERITEEYRAVMRQIRILGVEESYATKIRAEMGLEASRVMLGHGRVETTQIYAERDERGAMEVARRFG